MSIVLHYLVPTPSNIARVFHVIISKLDELSEHDDPDGKNASIQSISPEDYKECEYLLQTASNIIGALSQNGWVALLTHVLGNEKRPEGPKSEGR